MTKVYAARLEQQQQEPHLAALHLLAAGEVEAAVQVGPHLCCWLLLPLSLVEPHPSLLSGEYETFPQLGLPLSVLAAWLLLPVFPFDAHPSLFI